MNNKLSRWRNASNLTLALAVGFALTACEKTPPPATTSTKVEPSGQTVIIGSASPLTGGQSNLGKDIENGVRLAIDQANEAGVTINGNKVKFQLVSEDDQADPTKGPIVAQKLIDDKAVGVVANLNSGVSIPASQVYSQAGIPQISPASTDPKYTEQGFATTFRTLGRDDQQGPTISQYLVAHSKPKKVALIDDATAYGKGLANSVEKNLKSAKVRTMPRESGNDKTMDWKAVLTKIKGAKPDAVFYGGMEDTAGVLLKQAHELGIKATFAFGDGSCTSNLASLAGEAAAEGVICSQAGVPPQAASKEFLDAFKAKFNSDPIIYAPFSYDATRILIQAMKEANSTDPKVYLPFVKNIKYDGATGHIEFDDKGDRKDAEISIYHIKGGKLEPISVVKAGKIIPYEEFASTTASVVGGIKDAASHATDAVKDAASKATDAAKDKAGKATEAVKDAAGKAADAIKPSDKK